MQVLARFLAVPYKIVKKISYRRDWKMELLEHMKNRRSVRIYTGEPVGEEKLEQILQRRGFCLRQEGQSGPGS